VESKLRNLEMNVLDLKANFDRRINEVTHEIPARLTRELRNFESREH
jgi:hypothetical protein